MNIYLNSLCCNNIQINNLYNIITKIFANKMTKDTMEYNMEKYSLYLIKQSNKKVT